MLSIQIHKRFADYILPLLIVGLGIILLKDYFLPSLQIILGILVAPFIFRVRQKAIYSNRYFFAAIICILAYYFLYMKLFLFLSLGCFLFYSIESRVGKIGLLPFIFLICISPALHYVVTVFTFTLRIALSGYAADLMHTIGYPVQSCGNYFIMPDGFTFNVDKACLGLNMFNTGLALTALLIGMTEKNSSRFFSFFQLVCIFLTSCFLLIVTNFLRIITIVFFRSMPGTVSHELIGIFSLIVYMALPVYFLILFVIKRYGREEHIILKVQVPSLFKNIAFPLIAFALLFFSFTSVERKSKTMVSDKKLECLSLPRFSKIKKEDGVMEYRKDSILIYIKPAVKVFESDHPPVLCWKASGFDVEQVSEEFIDGEKIFAATLKKGKSTQYTAWWYDNGATKTIDQWTWRLNKGEAFRIVNITTNNKKELATTCKEFLRKKLF